MIASFFLSILGGVLVAITVVVLALILLVPFGVLFAVGVALFAFVSEPVGIDELVVRCRVLDHAGREAVRRDGLVARVWTTGRTVRSKG